jgi:hypothetical protein
VEPLPEATFDSAAEGVVKVGASTHERAMVALLTAHAREEEHLLEAYDRVGRQSASAVVRYLVALIVEDEHRHHRVLAELANAIAWEGSDRSPVRSVPDVRPGRDGGIVEQTKTLLDAEKADRRQVRKLRRELAAYRDTTAWPLLLELMSLDTEKHIRILRFIAEHAR